MNRQRNPLGCPSRAQLVVLRYVVIFRPFHRNIVVRDEQIGVIRVQLVVDGPALPDDLRRPFRHSLRWLLLVDSRLRRTMQPRRGRRIGIAVAIMMVHPSVLPEDMSCQPQEVVKPRRVGGLHCPKS